jgi:hypothetical protein
MKSAFIQLRLFVIVGACVAFSGLSAQNFKKLREDLSKHYENRSVIKEFQVGTLNTETENYTIQPVAKYNSLFASHGLGGYVAYYHSGPFRHHMFGGGGKFIYGRYYSPNYSQTIVFEAMFGHNTEKNNLGEKISSTNVYGFGVTGNFETKWVGASLGFSAGQFLLRNDENVNFFSRGRFSAFDIFGRWKIRLFPHRWFFLEYSANNLFLFQGGQGNFRQLAAGSGLGLRNGSEVKVGRLKFLKLSGYFAESTIYLRNKYGVGVNYSVYEGGSNYISFRFCYRLGNKKF